MCRHRMYMYKSLLLFENVLLESKKRKIGDEVTTIILFVLPYDANGSKNTKCKIYDNYPGAIILSRLHHQRRRRGVCLMSAESWHRRRMHAHARRVQGYSFLPAAVRRARNLWTDYARRILDNLRVRRQPYTS